MTRFIDLFAGIGGFRMAYDDLGWECVFTNERNKYALQTYIANYGAHGVAGVDIDELDFCEIPDHEVLVAGFPCQPFSQAGVSAKTFHGQAHGFECESQGTMFHRVARILKIKRPNYFILENVPHLERHDQGRTFQVIMRTLRGLGYNTSHRIINAVHWVPQGRKRMFIVGVHKAFGINPNLRSIELPESTKTLKDVLHPEDGTEEPEENYTEGVNGTVLSKFTLGAKTWEFLQRHAQKHASLGNGYSYTVAGPGDVARTLTARYQKDGSECLISRGDGKIPRKLTPRESARLMGFPDSFVIPVSNTQAYTQFGNSVVVPKVRAVGAYLQTIIDHIAKRNSPHETA